MQDLIAVEPDPKSQQKVGKQTWKPHHLNIIHLHTLMFQNSTYPHHIKMRIGGFLEYQCVSMQDVEVMRLPCLQCEFLLAFRIWFYHIEILHVTSVTIKS